MLSLILFKQVSQSIKKNNIMNLKTTATTTIVGKLISINNVLPTIFPPYFPEWFAGTIDGDGYFIRRKATLRRPNSCKATGLAIVMELKDLPLLKYIQKILNCGSIWKISNVKAYRFEINNKEAMIIIVNCINGYIRNTIRLPQFIEVCKRLDIVVKNPIILTKNSYYFAGYFDSDGCISFSLNKNQNNSPTLTISISNKYLENLQPIQDVFGGNISFSKNKTGGWHNWRIFKRGGILKIIAYFKDKCKSNKSVLFFIIDDYYRLRDLEAYKYDSIHHADWLLFTEKWKAREEFRTFKSIDY